MICLGIESSCDETALALVEDGQLIDSILATQVELHALFGGVVPELASREHYRLIGKLYDTLLSRNSISPENIDYYAVSRGPGLLGALLVGVAFAKGLALASQKPLIAINHLHAHLLAVGLKDAENNAGELIFPALGVLVSGGHTHLYHMQSPKHMELIGKTLDDAAGEAFDKVAKILGLPYPGGHILDQLAKRGTPEGKGKKLFPRPYTDNDNLDFSFSGLKTAAHLHISQHPELLPKHTESFDPQKAPEDLCHMCKAFVDAVVDTLCIKSSRALKKYPHIKHIILAGGVAANSHLRSAMQELISQKGGKLLVPSPKLCTDNAAMVAYAGWLYAKEGLAHSLDFETIPRGRAIPEDFVLIK